jgi:hypothetical protein
MPPTPQISKLGDLWGGGRRCVIDKLVEMEFYAILDPDAPPAMHVWDKVDECYHPHTPYVAQMLVQQGIPAEIVWIILNHWNAHEVLAWRWRRTVNFVRQAFCLFTDGGVQVDTVLAAMQAHNVNDISIVWMRRQEILVDVSMTREQRDDAVDDLMRVMHFLNDAQVTLIQYHLLTCEPMSSNPPWFVFHAIQNAWVPQTTLPF